MFVTLEELCETLGKTNTLQKAESDTQHASDPNNIVWKWQRVEGCELYYIFVYSKDGVRLPEHDTIAPQDRDKRDFTNIPKMQVMVLPLFRTDSAHGFVKMVEVRGLKDYELVIDLSIVQNENRRPDRLSATRFGFLCSSIKKCEEVKRVAVKLKRIESVEDEKKQIELALDAGGQYNAKYLACTKIEPDSEHIWIVMELFIMTFDVLIEEKKTGKQTYSIDEKKMKSCLRQILQGLIHLHSKGIFHGDIKLTNILLSLDGHYLKIGEYDNVSPEGNQESLRRKDIQMAGEMFLKCLKRDSQCNPANSLEKLSDTPTDLSKGWINKLKEFATSEGVSLMSAYFIMHARLDKPGAEELLRHLYFWNDLKTLDFITRMDAWFYDPLYSDESFSEKQIEELTNSVAEEVKIEFRCACEILSPHLNWITVPFLQEIVTLYEADIMSPGV